MPRCARCGNTISFGSSGILPASVTANGPVSGLVANFDEDGHITEMESMGADLDSTQEAWDNPDRYFDLCYQCGCECVIWE